MKKRTKLQTQTEGGLKPRQHGPQKEKTQITIRVDTDLINEAYAQMKEDGTRITDIIERGLILALAERNHQLPVWTKQVRFMVANATREQQALIRGLLIAMVEPMVLQDAGLDLKAVEGKRTIVAQVKSSQPFVKLTPAEEKWFECVRWYLEARNKAAHAHAAIEYYSRYGKSAEEIAELASL